MTEPKEWDYTRSEPTEPGWYAISYCWEMEEGSFVGADWWDGSAWGQRLPVVGFAGPFPNKSVSDTWAREHDPEDPITQQGKEETAPEHQTVNILEPTHHVLEEYKKLLEAHAIDRIEVAVGKTKTEVRFMSKSTIITRQKWDVVLGEGEVSLTLLIPIPHKVFISES